MQARTSSTSVELQIDCGLQRLLKKKEGSVKQCTRRIRIFKKIIKGLIRGKDLEEDNIHLRVPRRYLDLWFIGWVWYSGYAVLQKITLHKLIWYSVVVKI